MKNKEEMKMVVCATTTTLLGAGPQGPLPGDFPAARGLLPIHAIRGVAAVPTCHRLVFDGGGVGVQVGLLCNLLYVLVFSVRSQT